MIATGRYTPMQCSIEEMRQDIEGGARLVRCGKWMWAVVGVIYGIQGATLSSLYDDIMRLGTEYGCGNRHLGLWATL